MEAYSLDSLGTYIKKSDGIRTLSLRKGRKLYSITDTIKLRDLYEKSRAVQKPNISECICPDDDMTVFLIPPVLFDISERPVRI